MKPVLAALAAMAAFTAVPAAFAQAQCPDITAVDTDGSGDISMGELRVVMPDVTKAQFTAADADGSGSLSADEYTVLCGGAL